MPKQKRKPVKNIWRGSLVAIISIALAISFSVGIKNNTATAATNTTINFQARLLAASGTIVPDGNYNVEFKLYDTASAGSTAQGVCTGNCVWREAREGGNKVRVANGYLTVNLGSVTSFDSSINWDQELWLTMNIGGVGSPSYDGEMTPRLKLTAVPYALRANKLVGGTGSDVTILDTGTPSGTNTISLPAASGTVCLQTAASCGFALASGDPNYIQNQFSAAQSTSSYWISGTGRAATALQAPLIDAATSGALAIGSTNATVISLNQNVLLATSKTLTVQGNALFKPSVDANFGFEVQDSSANQLLRIDTSARKVAIGAYSTTAADNIGAQLQVLPTADSRVGINVKGFSGTYSGNYFEAQDSSNNYLFRLQSNGTLLTATGTFTSNPQSGVSMSSSNSTFGSGAVSGSSSISGTATVKSGDSTTSGNTGGVFVTSGNATSGNSGHTTIDVGTASGTRGSIYVGNTNAAGINIGRSGIITQITGTLVQNTGTFSLTGSGASSVNTTSGALTLQSVDANNTIVINGGSNAINLNTGTSGTITVGSSTTSTVNIGAQTNSARTINIGYAAASGQPQTVNIGAPTSTGAVSIMSGSGGLVLSSTASTIVRQSGTATTTAFVVQNVAGTSTYFGVDAFNGRVGIGTAGPGYMLDVSGDVNTSTVYRIGGTQMCSSAGCTASAASAIQNQSSSLQAANFKIQSAASNSTNTVTIAATATQTADLLQFQSSSGGAVAGIRPSGTIWSAPVTDPNTDVPSSARLFVQPLTNSHTAIIARAAAGGSPTGDILQLQSATGSSTYFSVGASGAVTARNGTDSSTAFRVQNATGNNLLQVSTASGEVSVGSSAQQAQLNLTGDISWGAALETAQGFESATFVPTSPGTWSTGGTSGWSRTTAQAEAGSAAAVSADVGDNQTSWLDLNYTFTQDGTFSFWWKVSSESGWDYLLFCYDNDSCTRTTGYNQRISGEAGWAKISIAVTAGAHSFRWLYAKDSSSADGSDIGWVDNVQFAGGNGTGAIRSESLTFVASDTITFQTLANANALVVDSNGRVGMNTSTPTEALSVVGNFSVADATSATKGYRFRTSGTVLDFEGGGSNLYVSTWTNANFTGTQYLYLAMYNTQSRMDVRSTYTYFNPATTSGNVIDVNRAGIGTLMGFAQDGTVRGSISVSGNTVSYNAFTGSHYALSQESIDRGFVVSMTGNNQRREADTSSEPYYGIAKTTVANDPKVLGAFLGIVDPSKPLSMDNPYQVMSVGNGDMWVDDEGGDIQAGDYLISSSLSGYAMKDTGTFAESNIIARASDTVTWSGETQVINGRKVKKISVLFTQFTRLNATGLAMGLTSGGLVSNDVTFNGLVMFNKAVQFKGDAHFEGLLTVSDNTAGTVKIPAGQLSASVVFGKPYTQPPKVTTGVSEFVDVVVDNKTTNGFTVRILSARSQDVFVDWTALQAP